MASFVGTPQQTTIDGTDEGDIITSASNVGADVDFVFNGLGGDDELVVSNAGNHQLAGGAGSDRLVVSGEGDSTLEGGAGDDVLVATAAGSHALNGGDGDDTIFVRAGGAATVDAGPGANSITLDAAASATVSAGTGANTIGVVANADTADPAPTITGFGDDDAIEFGNGAGLQAIQDAPDGSVSANAVTVQTGTDTTTLRADLTGDGTVDTVLTLDGAFAAADLSLDGSRLTTQAGADGGFAIDDLSDAEQVTALYVGYYGRDPDQTGFDFWFDAHASREAQGQSDGEIVARFASEFANVTETRERYPFFDDPTEDGADAFVNDVFQQLFDRQVDQAGEDFFSDRIVDSLENDAQIGQIVLDIINGAQNDDVTVLQGKIDAALEGVTIPTTAGATATADVDGFVA